MGELENLTPSVYWKKMLLDNDAGAAETVRLPSAQCAAMKKGIRECSVGILFLQTVKTGDTLSGMETFESSLVLLFSIDAKGNIVRNTVDLMLAG